MFNPLKVLIGYWVGEEEYRDASNENKWEKVQVKFINEKPPTMSYYMNKYFELMKDKFENNKTYTSTEMASNLHKQAMIENPAKKVTMLGLLPYWTAWQQPTGEIFYYNTKTDNTQWIAPVIPGWNQQFKAKYFGPSDNK